MTGLEINFDKSVIISVNCEEGTIRRLRAALKCKNASCGGEEYHINSKEVLPGEWQRCVKDQIAWTFSEDGQYTTKSFIDAVNKSEFGNLTMKHIFDNVWRRVVPPRVEMPLWFILSDGLKKKDVLLRRQIIRQGWEGAWNQTWCLVNQWSEKKSKMRCREVVGNGQGVDVKTKWLLWFYHCNMQDIDKCVVGGVVTNAGRSVRYWFGEQVDVEDHGDEYVKDWKLEYNSCLKNECD
ncbi:hypothetical protein PIB30_003539 [Stylosanthes scabra]|uniref:Reverse transcriptase zinc-binding domain-containing protein n=1 Tax=Stylosanthes scabra TaxID=79078 RepID=A0ABU6W3N6_9FABA|nr:hypothetical protein [Stylosanthes scabra]